MSSNECCWVSNVCCSQLLPFVAFQVARFAMALALYRPPGTPVGCRRGAPDVPQSSLVDALETCLDLDAGFKGNMMTKGWAELQQNGKVSKETMQANFLLLHTLLDINKVGIFKRVQI